MSNSAPLAESFQRGRDYLLIKLDDPRFPAPFYTTMIEVEDEEGLQLIWFRPNRD